jgi:hypothetical protein
MLKSLHYNYAEKGIIKGQEHSVRAEKAANRVLLLFPFYKVWPKK